MPRRSKAIVKTSISLEKDLLDSVDNLADEAETSRSEVIETILDYVMDFPDLVDEIFGELEEEEEEEEEAEEEASD